MQNVQLLINSKSMSITMKEKNILIIFMKMEESLMLMESKLQLVALILSSYISKKLSLRLPIESLTLSMV